MRVGRCAAYCVDYREHFITAVDRIKGGKHEADLGPQCGHDQLLAPGSFDRTAELDVFPGVDLGSIYLSVVGQDRLEFRERRALPVRDINCREHNRESKGFTQT